MLEMLAEEATQAQCCEWDIAGLGGESRGATATSARATPAWPPWGENTHAAAPPPGHDMIENIAELLSERKAQRRPP